MMELIDKSKVINVTAETGALETQSRVMDMPAVINIPNNATNADIIKALFPNYTIKFKDNIFSMRVENNWLNAPYKKESKDNT